MNTNQLIRDLTYPMKSIIPMRKAKVLQTFGNRENLLLQKKLKKPMKSRHIDKKINFFSS